METSYGIGVTNRYAVFLGEENEDPLELISKSTDKKSSSTTTKKVAVEQQQLKNDVSNKKDNVVNKAKQNQVTQVKPTSGSGIGKGITEKSSKITPKKDSKNPDQKTHAHGQSISNAKPQGNMMGTCFMLI